MYGIQRSYHKDVVERIAKLGGSCATQTIGELSFGTNTYPLFLTEIRNPGATRDILVSGGVHGNEPAGMLAALAFLETLGGGGKLPDDLPESVFRQYNFHVYPCVNPSGYEAVIRWNGNAVDLNRSFLEPAPSSETALVIEALKQGPTEYAMTFDLHETDPNEEVPGLTRKDNPTGYYLYEVCADKTRRVGHHMTAAAGALVPVCEWPMIYGDVNTRGVIAYPEACGNEEYAGGTTFEGYLIKEGYTEQAFTTETSTIWSLETRVEVHLASVFAALVAAAR